MCAGYEITGLEKDSPLFKCGGAIQTSDVLVSVTGVSVQGKSEAEVNSPPCCLSALSAVCLCIR
jgi:hypothetical protein